MRDIYDRTPPDPYDYHDTRAFHFTVPKPPLSLKSVQAIREHKDLFAQIGLQALQRAKMLV